METTILIQEIITQCQPQQPDEPYLRLQNLLILI